MMSSDESLLVLLHLLKYSWVGMVFGVLCITFPVWFPFYVVGWLFCRLTGFTVEER